MLEMKLVRYLRDAAVFAPCYVLLDWVSYIHPLGPFNITPWNPQPALAVAWMLLGGLVHAPVVLATILLADVAIRDVPLGISLLTALVLTAGYAAMADALRRVLRPKPDLRTLRQLTLFVAVVIPVTALVAGGFVGMLYTTGALGDAAVFSGWLRFSGSGVRSVCWSRRRCSSSWPMPRADAASRRSPGAGKPSFRWRCSP
jgi:two-component system, LuxR family, sensor kinase FixL